MKSNTHFSRIGSILVALTMAHMTALGQAPPSPGPEHEPLKRLEGEWTAKVKMGEDESSGIMTCKLECGGLWLISSYQGSFGGMDFQGRGMDGYDPEKKKYVSVWVDSFSARPMLLEGSYDKGASTMTMTGEGPGLDGSPAKQKMVTRSSDNDHMTTTMYIVGADGTETQMMTIEYTRKK